eukprot:IDg2270t1
MESNRTSLRECALHDAPGSLHTNDGSESSKSDNLYHSAPGIPQQPQSRKHRNLSNLRPTVPLSASSMILVPSYSSQVYFDKDRDARFAYC